MTGILKKFRKYFNKDKSNIGFLLIYLGITIALIFLLVGNYIPFNKGGRFDPEMIYFYSCFFGGVIGSIFSLAGFFIIYSTFRSQQKQNISFVFFQMFESFNNVRYKYCFLEVNEKKYYGLDAIKEISPQILYNVTEIFDKDRQIIMNMIEKNINSIHYYINSLNNLTSYLSHNKSLLEEDYQYYLDQLVFSLIEEEKKIVCSFYHAYDLETNDLILQIQHK